MAETIFSKILRNEIPCHKVYEDEHVLAFLDISPLSRGHTLVIPKEPAVTLDQLSEVSSAAIGRVLPRICRAVMQATGCPAYNLLQNNGSEAYQAVFHVHFHIIPKPNEQEGLVRQWRTQQLGADAAELSASIARAMQG
jgi:histidine triad (HIT) family protein